MRGSFKIFDTEKNQWISEDFAITALGDLFILSTGKFADTGRYKRCFSTGLKDQESGEIWEDDFLEFMIDAKVEFGIVAFYEGGFKVQCLKDTYDLFHIVSESLFCNIQGNQFQNPELLEAKENEE